MSKSNIIHADCFQNITIIHVIDSLKLENIKLEKLQNSILAGCRKKIIINSLKIF